MSFILINVRKPSFQRPLTWAFLVRSVGEDKSRSRCKSRKRKMFDLKDGFDDQLKAILQVPNYKGVGGARSNKQSNNRCNSGSKSMCCGGSRGAMVATLGGGSTSKLVFAVVRILAKTATSGGSNHQAGWVRAFNKELLNILKSFSERAGWLVGFGAFRIVKGQSSANNSTKLIGKGAQREIIKSYAGSCDDITDIWHSKKL